MVKVCKPSPSDAEIYHCQKYTYTSCTDADDEPDWMVASAREQKRKLLLQNRAEREAKLTRIREKEEKARLRFEKGEPVRKRQV